MLLSDHIARLINEMLEEGRKLIASGDNSFSEADVKPDDLMKFGLIPEIVGRLPIVTVLQELDEDALVKIMTEPKNALVKQYKKLFGMDEVDLSFDDDALHAIAKKTLEKETGARGLRSITEGILLPIMYDIPSEGNVQSVQITKECIENGEKPIVIFKEEIE